MPEEAAKPDLQPFPVRVGAIVPTRIDFEAFAPPSEAKPPEYHDPAGVVFSVGVKYHLEEDSGVVLISAEATFEKPGGEPSPAKPPYRLNVGASAPFIYDPKEISKDEVAEWCAKGAFFVVSPYLRLLVFFVTGQSGFPTITLPLVKVPMFREKPLGRKPDAAPRN
jgi:hypothetical protein